MTNTDSKGNSVTTDTIREITSEALISAYASRLPAVSRLLELRNSGSVRKIDVGDIDISDAKARVSLDVFADPSANGELSDALGGWEEVNDFRIGSDHVHKYKLPDVELYVSIFRPRI